MMWLLKGLDTDAATVIESRTGLTPLRTLPSETHVSQGWKMNQTAPLVLNITAR